MDDKTASVEPSEALLALHQQMLFADDVPDYQEGRDELNLAEFPIAALSNRVNPKEKTVVFEDFTSDRSTGEIITRRLTVSASDAYGLPTASDDEIILGLLQLSRIQGFRSPKVIFTPYQLMKILGWPPTTKNYRRLNEGINRWLGVTLYYDNAWRDKRTQQWVDRKMHFLEYAEIYKPGNKGTLAPEGYSCFKWNDLVFQSFQAGNMKTLDFHLFRSLNSGIAKRMFRFLDKRFHFRRKLTFDLERFAFDKMGIPRSYTDTAQIKRRLMPGIVELEEMKVIRRLPPEARFTKARKGTWEVHFESLAAEPAAPAPSGVSPAAIREEEVTALEGRLISHGVSRSQARKLTSEYDDERIESQLDVLEFLLAKGGPAAPENRGGWLVQAITQNYSMPRGFRSRAQIEEETRERAEKARLKEESKRRRSAEQQARDAERDADWEEKKRTAQHWLDSLPRAEREDVERQALSASLFKGRIGPVREAVITNYVLSIMES